MKYNVRADLVLKGSRCRRNKSGYMYTYKGVQCHVTGPSATIFGPSIQYIIDNLNLEEIDEIFFTKAYGGKLQ